MQVRIDANVGESTVFGVHDDVWDDEDEFVECLLLSRDSRFRPLPKRSEESA